MTISKAPSGGMASKVNGQWYEGGEFMPLHGLFCGAAGAKRAATWKKAEKSNRAKDLGGSKMYRVSVPVGGGVWNILGYAIADDAKTAAAAFTAPCKIYAFQV
jgi:hypothetical protein